MPQSRAPSWKDDQARAGEPEVVPFWRPRLSLLGWTTLLALAVAGPAFILVIYSIYRSRRSMYEYSGTSELSLVPFGLTYNMTDAYEWSGPVHFFHKLDETALTTLVASLAVFAICVLVQVAIASARKRSEES